MDEDLEIQLHQLAGDEIRELLAEEGTDVSLEEAEVLARFVAEAGSMEEAQRLLTQLAEQDKAA